MNEFIVWIKCLKRFEEITTRSDYSFLGSYFNDNRCQVFNGIGLKDINNNSIYANSSIVEFEWGSNSHNLIGYFTFNKEYLVYEIMLLNSQKCLMKYDPYSCSNIKIIDTIQENKLGLVK